MEVRLVDDGDDPLARLANMAEYYTAPAPEPEPELSGLSLKGWAGGGRAEPASLPLLANDQAETDAALDLDAAMT